MFYRKGIPNGVQLTCQFLMIFYGPKEAPGVKELGQKSPEPSTRVGGAPHPLGVDPYLEDESETPLLVLDAKTSYIYRNPQNIT